LQYKIEILNDDNVNEYSDFIIKNPKNILYTSVKFKLLIEKILNVESFFLLVVDENDKIKGALPLMIYHNRRFGNIANSLPFYGSNGEVLFPENIEIAESGLIQKILIREAINIAESKNCKLITFISNPFSVINEWSNFEFDFLDERISQIKIFDIKSNNPDIDGSLMSSLSGKTRNMVRKAYKSGINFYASNNISDLEFIYKTHLENLNTLGGIAKPESFFSNIPDIFNNEEYRIYIAEKDGVKISGVLLFYFNKTIEYYTPVIVNEFRSFQPLSLLIFEAMKDGINWNYGFWDWGGTWLTQDGVYHFKKMWGSEDLKYYYYVKILDKNFLRIDYQLLQKEYPYFYCYPFKGRYN
jgi:hypothetical protein